MQTIFYSWQSDLPNSTNRGFIEDCLTKAIRELRAEGSVHIDPSPDRDTQGVPGSPAIADTIFAKIDACAAFVADVSFINGRKKPDKAGCDCTRLTPNPNVLCEWGWAVRSLTFDRVICVLNTATGKAEDLPFDMRGRRGVTYRLIEGEDKAEQRKALVSNLKAALKEILKLPSTALSLEFGDLAHRKPIGASVKVEGIFCEIPPLNEIPDYGAGVAPGPFGWMGSIGTKQPNPEYYRAAAHYLLMSNLLRPLSLVVKNVGERLLGNVRLEAILRITDGDGVWFSEKHKMPEIPERWFDSLPGVASLPKLSGKFGKPSPGDVEIQKLPDEFHFEIKFGNIQPKATVFSEIFLGGSRDSRQVSLGCRLFADELKSPEEFTLTIDFATEKRKLALDDLKQRLPGQKVLVDTDEGEIIDDD